MTAIADLAGIRRDGNSLWLGAAVTLADLARHADILAHFPALAEAALAVAGPGHRAAATLGGNLCQDTRCIFYNQSDWWREGNGWCLKYRGDKCHVVVKSDRCYATYHGDVAPVLMVLDAEAVVAGPDKARRIKVADLYIEDGADHLTLAPGEVLAAVVLPPPGNWRSAYAKARVRDGFDFPLAGVAAALRRDGDIIGGLRLAITGTNSAPLAIDTHELVGRAWNDEAAALLVAALKKKANVLRTTVTGPKYRRRAMQGMARRLVNSLWDKQKETARTRDGRMKSSKVAVDVQTKANLRGEQEMSYGLLPRILGYHLRRTQVAIFQHFSRTVAAKEDITPGLFGMLQVIAANPGLGQSRLAETMEVDRSTIVKVVDQLEERGLIMRESSPVDKRSHCLRLTDKGRTALRRMEALVLRHEDEFTKTLSAEERRFLVRLLMRLYRKTNGGSFDAARA